MTTITTPSTKPGAAHGADEPIWGYMAEFDTAHAITEAAKRVRDEGYRWWDTHTPFPVHGLDKAMGIKPTILPILVFGGGATGIAMGWILQWFTNASSFDFWAIVPVRGYEYLISGKPMISWPAWVPVLFEMMVLFSALACVSLLFLLCGLPRFYHPTLKHPGFARASDDRFFVVIEARDPKFSADHTRAFLESLAPLSVEPLEP